MQKLFKFESNKTYFGLDIHRLGVKVSDIETLPFYDFFVDSHVGSTYMVNDDESYIYLHDWENFCYGFILSGKHRYSK